MGYRQGTGGIGLATIAGKRTFSSVERLLSQSLGNVRSTGRRADDRRFYSTR